jgi:site-specific DNA-methyltransferase (adenine-specific)
MASGLGLNDFRKTMLEDKRIKKIVDFPVSSEVFNGVEVKGGICYFLWEREYNGACEFTSVRNNEIIGSTVRNLSEFDILVRDSRALPILRKVLSKKEESIIDILSVDKEFGWTSNFNDFSKNKKDGYIPLHFIKKGKRDIGWISREKITKSTQLIDTWKVLVPKAGSDGGQKIPDSVLGKPLVASAPSVCTQSFLFFFVNSQNEALNVNSYYQTKFFRFIVSLRKFTQDATRSTYTWVPQQNFSEPWTDEKLYKKYGLTEEEIAFIESMIRPMENSENGDSSDVGDYDNENHGNQINHNNHSSGDE